MDKLLCKYLYVGGMKNLNIVTETAMIIEEMINLRYEGMENEVWLK